MTNILLVQKGGEIKQTKIKDINSDSLYKKCGFRKNTDFEKRTTWEVTIGDTKYYIELWAKINSNRVHCWLMKKNSIYFTDAP